MDEFVETPAVAVSSRVNKEVRCDCCYKLQRELEEALLELSPALKKKVKNLLLHEEAQCNASKVSAVECNQISTVIREQTKNTSVNWNQVTSNSSVHNKKIEVQQSRPMPTIVNLYAIQDNLQNDLELTQLQGQKNKIDRKG
jgi:phosphatidate phosphatase PAH1